MKALHKDPARCHADARGLASDLRAFLEGRLSWIERGRDMARLHPFRAIMLSIVALALLALGANVVVHFWTDQRLANRAVERVAALDAELAMLAGEAESVRAGLEDGKSNGAKRAELNKQLHELDARWVLTEFEALRLLVAVAEMRFVWVEGEIQPLARQRLMDLVESLLERDQPALAKGLIENVLERHSAGSSALQLGDGDVAKPKQFAAKADQRFVAPRD